MFFASAHLRERNEWTVTGSTATPPEPKLALIRPPCMTAPRLESAQKPSQRQPELDALRGLLLVWMTLTHLPTHVSEYANQPFGFISAAEGFVFLSAVLTGKLHAKYATESRAGELFRKLGARALRVYWYHCALLLFAFTVGAFLATWGPSVPLHNLLDFYFARPLLAIAGSLVLIYRPPLLDILPMYVLFLLGTPLLLLGARRYRWRWMLGASALIWLGAQFGLREEMYSLLTKVSGINIPLPAQGAFNLYAWQFLWAVGVWLGVEMFRERNPFRRLPRGSVWVALAIVVACACLRRDWPTDIFWTGSLRGLEDKWRMAPLRVLDATAMCIVVWHCRRAVRFALGRGILPLLGMASIQVFSAQVVFVFLGLALIHDPVDTLVHGWRAALLVVLSMAGLVAVGWTAATRKMQERNQRRLARRPSLATSPSGKLEL